MSNTGLMVFGELLGVFSTENNGYKNFYIGIKTGDEKDEFNRDIEVIEKIELVNENEFIRLTGYSDKFTGKKVCLNVYVDFRQGEKNGRHWAFSRLKMKSGSDITESKLNVASVKAA